MGGGGGGKQRTRERRRRRRRRRVRPSVLGREREKGWGKRISFSSQKRHGSLPFPPQSRERNRGMGAGSPSPPSSPILCSCCFCLCCAPYCTEGGGVPSCVFQSRHPPPLPLPPLFSKATSIPPLSVSVAAFYSKERRRDALCRHLYLLPPCFLFAWIQHCHHFSFPIRRRRHLSGN